MKVWNVVKILFLAFVVGALFYAVAYGEEFKLPAELSFLNEAEVIQVFSCEKKDTGEKAICVIFATEEAIYMLAIDPETKRVREAFKQEGGQVIQIYGMLKPA